MARRLLALMPNFSADTEAFVFRESGKLDLILDGMRKAGLPA